MRKLVIVLMALVLFSPLLMAQDAPKPDASALTDEVKAEFQKLKESNDEEGQKAIVSRIKAARLAKYLQFLGDRKALFPKEIAGLEGQLGATVWLVLNQGSNPNVNTQSAQWKWVDVGVIALAVLVDYDCRFIDSGFNASDFKMISYAMGEGYMEQTQKCAAELWNARKNLTYTAYMSLLKMGGKSARQEGLTTLNDEITKQMAGMSDPTVELKGRIKAILKLRKAFLGIRGFKADPDDLATRFPEGSEDGTMFASMAAKEKAYLDGLLAIAKAKDSDPELKLAAACAWTAMETNKLTKAQIAEIKKDKFRGIAIPELSRYATLPSAAPSPLIAMEDE